MVYLIIQCKDLLIPKRFEIFNISVSIYYCIKIYAIAFAIIFIFSLGSQ